MALSMFSVCSDRCRRCYRTNDIYRYKLNTHLVLLADVGGGNVEKLGLFSWFYCNAWGSGVSGGYCLAFQYNFNKVYI